MAVQFKQKVLFTSTVSSTTSVLTTTEVIYPGDDIFIASGRAIASGGTNGISGAVVSAGAVTFERVATSCNASTLDTVLIRLRCTTLIPLGSTVTVTHRSAAVKRGLIMQVVSGLTSATADASSGNTADNTAGNVAGGSQGSSTSAATSSLATTTVANTLVLCAFGEGGTNTFTAASGTTKIDESRTTSGTADRGVGLFYKIVSATGVQTANATVAPTGSWAGALGAFAITAATVKKQTFFPHL